MRSSSRITYMIISCLILSILLYFGRSFVLDFIIEPLTQILWLIIRIFQSVDQEIYWILLIFIIFLFGIFLIPDWGNRISPVKYTDSIRHDGRIQFWKRIISTANKNNEDRIILQSNLNQIHKEVTAIYERDDFEEILLPPLKKSIWSHLYSFFLTSGFFDYLQNKHLIKKNESSRAINDFLKSIETTMEIKNGNIRNKSSDS